MDAVPARVPNQVGSVNWRSEGSRAQRIRCSPLPQSDTLEVWPFPNDSFSTPSADALRLLDGVGFHSRRAARYGPPRLGRRHLRAGEPRHRPPAVEPEILPDGSGYRRDRMGARLRHAVGLRADLPASREWLTLLIRRMDPVVCVYRLAAFDVPRHRRAKFPRRVPPQRVLRRHHRPPRRPQLRCGPP